MTRVHIPEKNLEKSVPIFSSTTQEKFLKGKTLIYRWQCSSCPELSPQIVSLKWGQAMGANQ